MEERIQNTTTRPPFINQRKFFPCSSCSLYSLCSSSCSSSSPLLSWSLSRMPFASISEAIEDFRAGRMLVVVDDEDRENEGDVTVAAEKVTPDIINFMAKHARGLICLSLTPELCDALALPPMSAKNNARLGTAFTESIEAAEGVTTGISAADRAHTIAVAMDPH